jgi:hypothetical protein
MYRVRLTYPIYNKIFECLSYYCNELEDDGFRDLRKTIEQNAVRIDEEPSIPVGLLAIFYAELKANIDRRGKFYNAAKDRVLVWHLEPYMSQQGIYLEDKNVLIDQLGERYHLTKGPIPPAEVNSTATDEPQAITLDDDLPIID